MLVTSIISNLDASKYLRKCGRSNRLGPGLGYPRLVKVLLIAVLVVVIFLVALPLPMTSGAAWCPGCLAAHSGHLLYLCLGMLPLTLVILVVAFRGRMRALMPGMPAALRAQPLVRPPRFAPAR